MRIGIVGLPNAGKSTLFNALTGAAAEAAEYPFTTVDPNVAIVPVPDRRLDRLGDALGIERRVPAHVEFVDIAGLVRGAHKGEGLGNRFLGHIRAVDAILHVVRCFESGQVAHPHGELDPAGDAATVEAELLLADLETAERRLEAAERALRGGEKAAGARAEVWRSVTDGLAAGRAAPREAGEAEGLLTSKPVLIVANVGQGEGVPGAFAGREAIAVCAGDEAELAALDPAEARAMRSELGLDADALEEVVRVSYRLLGLITFFTAVGGRELHAWSLRRGATALDAAGTVHTDMREGFVRAEVIGADDLVECGSVAAARERGLLRIEGRDYEVRDGDVVAVRFTSRG